MNLINKMKEMVEKMLGKMLGKTKALTEGKGQTTSLQKRGSFKEKIKISREIKDLSQEELMSYREELIEKTNRRSCANS